MVFWRKSKPVPTAFQLPPGERVYAIGDIHGRLDLFRQMLDMIEQDDLRRKGAQSHLILLGDLIDRGPDSAGVVALARSLVEADENVHFIKGNHEEVFVEASLGDAKAARALLRLDGHSTLQSYGITRGEVDKGTFEDLAELMKERIPRDDVRFLHSGQQFILRGNYLFVHAGIAPGRAISEQTGSDLRWIRQPFLDAVRNDGLMVIHGHTPTPEIDIRPDRIGIDTGAYESGILTAIGIEAGERWFLQTGQHDR